MSIQTYQWGNTRRSSFRVERWTWSMRGWLLVALILAVLLHWWMFQIYDTYSLHQASARMMADPRPERIAVNPEVLQDRPAQPVIPDIIAPSDSPPEPDTKADFQDIVEMLPDDRALDLTPDVNKVTNFIAPDSVPNATVPAQAPSMAAIADSLTGSNDLASAAEAIKSSALNKAVSDKQLILPGREIDKELQGIDGKMLDRLNKDSVAGNAAAAKVQGFSNLDELINRGNKLNASTDPILMPTDLLFSYGSAELADNARLSLMKLGLLIQRNPNSRFIIEGHTDTFGTDEFNFELSQRRANAVVDWLISSLRLSTDRIQAVGMGKTRTLVGGATPEQQALNRRVEIKVRPLR
jgi:outer membrane protein OmpA-like peptidoglycan-associated protein